MHKFALKYPQMKKAFYHQKAVSQIDQIVGKQTFFDIITPGN